MLKEYVNKYIKIFFNNRDPEIGILTRLSNKWLEITHPDNEKFLIKLNNIVLIRQANKEEFEEFYEVEKDDEAEDEE